MEAAYDLTVIEGRAFVPIVEVPWKNGKGVTHQISLSPPSSSLKDFDYRVSSAKVETTSDFSIFEGVERTLVVVGGNKLLSLVYCDPDQGRTVFESNAGAVFSFSGDSLTKGILHSTTPIRDFNVFTRRGVAKQTLKVLSPLSDSNTYSIDPTSSLAIFIPFEDSVVSISGDESVTTRGGTVYFITARSLTVSRGIGVVIVIAPEVV